MWEAEIGRTPIRGQFGQKLSKISSEPVHMVVVPIMQEALEGGSWSKASQAKKQIVKIPKAKKSYGCGRALD
jgi:hypothetical protein